MVAMIYLKAVVLLLIVFAPSHVFAAKCSQFFSQLENGLFNSSETTAAFLTINELHSPRDLSLAMTAPQPKYEAKELPMIAESEDPMEFSENSIAPPEDLFFGYIPDLYADHGFLDHSIDTSINDGGSGFIF
jgi:hypothetical protein